MMKKNLYKSVKSRFMSSLPVRFLTNKEGVAAVEFVFVAPLMIGMYFGMAELAAAIATDRQISHSANVAGDLTTQTGTVSAAEMADILEATIVVMGVPIATAEQQAKVKIEIASFGRNASGDLVENGKATLNGPYPTPFDAENLDETILSSSSGVVVARVNYVYTPLQLRHTSADINLNETFMLKPRTSTIVQIINPDDGRTEYDCNFTGGSPSCGQGSAETET